MKKTLFLLLAAALLLSACGGAAPSAQPSSPVLPNTDPNAPIDAGETPVAPDGTDAAGEAAPVPEVVEIYDALQEIFSYSDDLGNRWDVVLRIPAIKASGEDANLINMELYSALYPYVLEVHEAMDSKCSLGTNRVDYQVFINGNLISILCQVDNDWGQSRFFAACFDCGTRQRVGRSELLARFGLTEDSFLPLAADTVDQYFQSAFGNIPQDDFWRDRHDNSIAPENFRDDCQLYVNNAGQLCMIVKLYSFAGADYYYHDFALT